MDSRLFAFRVARPVEITPDNLVEFRYDPQSQTTVWAGNSKAVAAVFCTHIMLGPAHCTVSGGHCSTSGAFVPGGFTCD